MYDRLKLVSLSATPKLAEDIAKIIGVDIMPTKLIRFADNEILFEGQESFRGDNVYIVQSTCSPVNDNFFEVFLAIDACKRAGAASITCVMPYLGYSRQDRKAKARQPISCKVVADLLTTCGADRVVCVDLHASQTAGFFDIPVDDISSMPLFYKYLSSKNLDDVVCVSPDHGGVVRTSLLADKLNVPLAIIDKRRPAPNKSAVIGIVGDIKDKNCIIIDDMIDTAGTLCNAAAKLKEMGAKKIIACGTHAVFSGNAIENIKNSVLDEVVVTDSIPLPECKQCDKIKVISLAPLLANIVKALEEGVSLSGAIKEYANQAYGR